MHGRRDFTFHFVICQAIGLFNHSDRNVIKKRIKAIKQRIERERKLLEKEAKARGAVKIVSIQ
jgi:hypothetical protein